MQRPYFCKKPDLTISTSQSSSHRCPSQARDSGWMASPPEMPLGIPSAAQGQPPGAQHRLCPSSLSSHLLLLLLHPHVPLHGQGRRESFSPPSTVKQLSCTPSGPFPGSYERHRPPRGGASPGGGPCKVHSRPYGLPPSIPSPGFASRQLAQPASRPSGHCHPHLLRMAPELTLSLSDLCLGHRTRAEARSELFHCLLSSRAARADRRGRSLP